MVVFWYLALGFGVVGGIGVGVAMAMDSVPLRAVSLALLGTAALMVFFALIFGRVRLPTRRLLERGITASARILAVRPTAMRVNRRPVFRFRLEVQCPGTTPYELDHWQPVTGHQSAMLVRGLVLAAKVHPRRPRTLVLLFDGTAATEGAVVGGVHWAGTADASTVLARGLRGHGRIVELVHTGRLTDDGRPLFVLTLDVTPGDGRPAYPNRAGYAVPKERAAWIALGREVPLRVDATDPTIVAIDWAGLAS